MSTTNWKRHNLVMNNMIQSGTAGATTMCVTSCACWSQAAGGNWDKSTQWSLKARIHISTHEALHLRAQSLCACASECSMSQPTVAHDPAAPCCTEPDLPTSAGRRGPAHRGAPAGPAELPVLRPCESTPLRHSSMGLTAWSSAAPPALSSCCCRPATCRRRETLKPLAGADGPRLPGGAENHGEGVHFGGHRCGLV